MPRIQLIPASVAATFDRIQSGEASIGVAYSAGSDSTLALLEAVERFGATRVVALHYDHRMRGAESDDDAAFAEAFARSLGARFAIGRRPKGGAGDEAALRRDRLEFLRSTAKEHCLSAIITGHHADDVAETLLLRIARGAGSAGLAAPRPISIHRDGTVFLRPLLLRKKDTIQENLKKRGITWREDSGNHRAEVARRNALRLHLMPQWNKIAGPDPITGALRTRTLMEEDADALDAWTTKLESKIRPGTPNENWTTDEEIPKAILRRLLHRKLIQIGRYGALGESAFEKLLKHIAENTPTRLSVHAGFIRYDGKKITIQSFTRENQREAAMLPVPGSVFWPDGAALHITPSNNAVFDPKTSPHLAVTIATVLHCAPAIPGARYRAIGAPGSAKISDMMINKKIPREIRKALPLVSDDIGPLWAPGLPPSERLMPTDGKVGPLRLTWIPPDAP